MSGEKRVIKTHKREYSISISNERLGCRSSENSYKRRRIN